MQRYMSTLRRGGHVKTYQLEMATLSYRDQGGPAEQDYWTGFRCACDP